MSYLVDRLRERRKARFQRERDQSELIPARELHKLSIAAKLIGVASGPQMDNFQRCGVEELYCTCKDCGKTETFFYGCNRKWCPRCAPRLAKIRADKLRLWVAKISQPKHLVLTMRNFPVLTRREIRRFQKALLKLRKQKLWSKVKGGCMTMEVTNTGEGWHLHAHCLLDVRWLDMEQLAKQWADLLDQNYGIVKVKDCRGTDYLNEVAKYVAKGSELATWSPEQLWEFICAIKGVRFFAAFGSLFKMTKQIRAELAMSGAGQRECECGSQNYVIENELTATLSDIRQRNKRR
jgi:Replication protein